MFEWREDLGNFITLRRFFINLSMVLDISSRFTSSYLKSLAFYTQPHLKEFYDVVHRLLFSLEAFGSFNFQVRHDIRFFGSSYLKYTTSRYTFVTGVFD